MSCSQRYMKPSKVLGFFSVSLYLSDTGTGTLIQRNSKHLFWQNFWHKEPFSAKPGHHEKATGGVSEGPNVQRGAGRQWGTGQTALTAVLKTKLNC